MADAIIILLVLVALAAAISYIVKAKKRGVKCIGCSAAGSCASAGNPAGGCTACGNVDEIVEQIKCGCQTEKK